VNPPTIVLFDTCTLRNFAVVGRLDLLEKLYSGRAAWTDGTEYEVRRAIREAPTMASLLGAAWLGLPIVVGNLPPAAQQVDRLRRAIGGNNLRGAEHLGEAQIIHHLLAAGSGIIATDDRSATDYAARKGIATIDSVEILGDCFDAGLVGCPAAYQVLIAMTAAGRGIKLPASHLHVCPG
jgi:predicted nucleic acid-binding protein